jgi:hypothetical protein
MSDVEPANCSGAEPNIVRTAGVCQRERGVSRKTELRPAQRRAAADGRLKSSAGWCVGYGCVLGLGAARPTEPVIEANDDRVEIGANADRRNGVEIVILAPEVIEIILDLAGEIFH